MCRPLALLGIAFGMVAAPLLAADASRPLSIAAIRPAADGQHIGRHDAAALAFAKSQCRTTILRPGADGAWGDAESRPRFFEEFDVLWRNQGDGDSLQLDRQHVAEIVVYLKHGGVLLLSGAAGSLLNDLGVESTSLRVIGPTDVASVSGIRVRPEYRGHPAFRGLHASQPVLLTSIGGAALADFWGTAGPHGTILADGNCSDGERPLAVYAMPLVNWWGNPSIGLSPGPRMIQSPAGVRVLTVGRPPLELGEPPKNVLALCSWRPYPWPAAAKISVGLPCRRIWLLWQNYVHPIKNYLVNGEVVLCYADGRQTIVSLVPPYNLDCYFQHFARRGESMPFGYVPGTSGFAFVDATHRDAHADLLEVPCNEGKVLASVCIRATCSEGALGVLGMTAEQGKTEQTGR